MAAPSDADAGEGDTAKAAAEGDAKTEEEKSES